MHKPWVLAVNMIWGGDDTTYQVICDSWRKFVEEKLDSGNVFLVILCRNMDDYIQHWNALHISDHTYNVYSPFNCDERSGQYKDIKCDVNNNLCTVLEANNSEFCTQWQCIWRSWKLRNWVVTQAQFFDLGTTLRDFNRRPTNCVWNISRNLITDGKRKICQNILDKNWGEYQRISRNGIVGAAKLYIGESITDDGYYI